MRSDRAVPIDYRRTLGTANSHPAFNRNYTLHHSFVDLSKQISARVSYSFLPLATDLPFVLRIVVQGLLPGLPPDLSVEAQNLSANLNPALQGIDQMSTGLVELCPACHVEVPLVDITNALCPNGHAWSTCFTVHSPSVLCSSIPARCTVTSFILATTMVRTCIGCSRKAFLPLSQNPSGSPNWLPVAARSWIVEELLEAVNRCLFCGNSFVSIL